MHLIKTSDGTCIFAEKLNTSAKQKTLILEKVEFQDIHTKLNIKLDHCLVYKAYVILSGEYAG